MLFRLVEILGNEEPAGDLLAVGSGKMDELRLNELESVRRTGGAPGFEPMV